MLLPPLCAIGYVGLAVKAGETWFACASVAVNIIGASAPVLAGAALALVDLNGASLSCEARQAGAVEGVYTIRAGASTETWICGWTERNQLLLSP